MERARVMLVLGLAVAVAGCSTPMTTREKGAVAGGAIGAGTGAIIGSQTGHAGTGALIGAGIGAVSGALIGDAIQGAEQKQAAPAAATPAPAPVVVVQPPPLVAAPPQLVVVPGTPVYYAPALSVNYFVYRGRHYTFHNGSWFVAGAYNGPWTFVAVEKVPQPVLAVPVAYYKVPPGHMKNEGHGKGHKNKKWKDDDD